MRVRSIDEAEAKELAESNGGWVESMRDSLGRLGVVTDVAKGGKMVRVKTAPPYIGSTYKQWWWWYSKCWESVDESNECHTTWMGKSCR